jgi:capsular polysaccharide biosynthesis protein
MKHPTITLVWLRKSLFVVVSFLVFSAISLAIVLWPRSYVATAKVLIEMKPADANASGVSIKPLSQNHIATQIEILHSAKVAAKVGELLQLSSNQSTLEQYRSDRSGTQTFTQFYTARLKRGITATQSGDASVIEISYKTNDPVAAAHAANAFVKAYAGVRREIQPVGTVFDSLVVLDDATPPHSPASPRVISGFTIALLLAPLIGFMAVLFTEALDRRVRSRLDLEVVTGMSVLCVVGNGRPSRTLNVLQTVVSFLMPTARKRTR